MNDVSSVNKFEKIHYLSRFIARSFLIAVLFFISFLTIMFFIYFADMTIHSKNPLFGTYLIVSPSMVPTIKINDAIVIKRVDHDRYNIGDIITFASSDINYKGLAITHRIVDKETKNEGVESRYTTKGDNNLVVDPTPVETEDIYGRVLFRIPGIGKVQNFLSKPFNYFICILVTGLLFAVYEIGRIFKMLFKTKKV